MLVQQDPPLHLTYCMNVHPGESLPEVIAAVTSFADEVRVRVSPDRPFGLGLRLGPDAVDALQGEALASFKSLLADRNMYAFTLNGFPYGRFHGTRVKENVYAPDWRSPERLSYTKKLADVLAALLPEGMTGSISTVPVSFRPWIPTIGSLEPAVFQLLELSAYLDRLEEETGRDIRLALEPEPACYLETTQEFIQFFNEHLLKSRDNEVTVRKRIGICVDTCHAAVQFEHLESSWDLLVAEGIAIPKVQLSAALRCDAQNATALEPFAEGVYLHQTRQQQADGTIRSWLDLPGMLQQPPGVEGELRVHFHVPLYWKGDRVLRSTAGLMTPAFFERLRLGHAPHLEIETYTFDVLPQEIAARGAATTTRAEDVVAPPRGASSLRLKSASIVDSIEQEYRWTLQHRNLS